MSDDFDPAVFREAHADDKCMCGHVRRMHYAPGGSTVGCSSVDGYGRPCSCRDYALDLKWESATRTNGKAGAA